MTSTKNIGFRDECWLRLGYFRVVSQLIILGSDTMNPPKKKRTTKKNMLLAAVLSRDT